MTDDERLAVLWAVGLRSEGLGPIQEWAPVHSAIYQKRHDKFWRTVSALLPDDEDEEAYWMTEDAALELKHN